MITRTPAPNTRPWRRVVAYACCLALLPLFGTAQAQLIPIKTAPVADGDQFGFLPTANLGMGGVSIAIPDTLLDPFINPAKAARVRRGHFFGSPSFYSFSQKAGSGRTLPLGALLRSGSWFGGLTIAVQEINPAAPINEFGGPVVQATLPGSTFVNAASAGPQSRSNRYASALLGGVIPKYNLSLAASAFWSGLNAVDGVDQMYAGSQSVTQSGDAFDVRFGILKEWKGDQGDQSFEAVVVHNRFGVTHDVNYLDLFWDPGGRQVLQRPRVVQNAERTRTTGVHLEYERPLADSGWRIGALLTANRVSQPAAAQYDITNVPREPGRSAAFNVGMGVSKSQGPTTFGVDAIYEPIWSHTRTDVTENRFRFSNSILRAGVSRDFELDAYKNSSLRLQLGVQLRSIHYWLDEYNNEQPPIFDRQESWKEWGNSWGASFRFPEVEVHYRFRSTSGAGRPGLPVNEIGFRALDVSTNSFFPQPNPLLTLTGVRVTTQQFSVSVPIR